MTTTDTTPPNGISVWITRAGVALDVLSKFSLTTFLLVLFGLGIAAWFGWIESPLTGYPGVVLAHDRRMVEALNKRAELDDNFLRTLEEMSKEMKRSSAAYRVRICSEIAASDVRRRCLDQ